MKKFLLFFFSLLVFSSGVSAQIAAKSLPKDGQIWTDLQLILPLRQGTGKKGKSIDKIVLNLDGIVRFGRNVSYATDRRLSANADFRINKFLKITPGYLYQRFEQFPRQRNYETRLTIAGNLEKKFEPFTFRHRSMFEYRRRNSRADTQIYRSRFQVSYPFKLKKKEIFAPFASEEAYYDFQLHSWNRNEIFLGITRRLTKKTALDLFYVKLDARPVNANALGVTLKIKLW